MASPFNFCICSVHRFLLDSLCSALLCFAFAPIRTDGGDTPCLPCGDDRRGTDEGSICNACWVYAILRYQRSPAPVPSAFGRRHRRESAADLVRAVGLAILPPIPETRAENRARFGAGREICADPKTDIRRTDFDRAADDKWAPAMAGARFLCFPSIVQANGISKLLDIGRRLRRDRQAAAPR